MASQYSLLEGEAENEAVAVAVAIAAPTLAARRQESSSSQVCA